ncbi:MAG TPA: hypothetical protein VMG41_14280 [Gemmatimonadales bacterium]|nr:hypothetical protein [Gemmatimonadales bacterium]
MIHIRLASGQEYLFRSVEELAHGIQSGLVSETAEIYHGKAQQWLPIAVHPVFERASTQAAHTVTMTEQERLDFAASPEKVQGGTVPIYQMLSKSGVELAERRRPKWIGPAAGVAGGLGLVACLAWILMPSGIPDPMGDSPLATARQMTSLGTASPFATLSVHSWDDSPANLAIRLARTTDSLSHRLARKARDLGLRDLLDTDRLSAEERVRGTLQSLFAFEPVIAAHRQAERGVLAAYQDSAAMLERTGAWTPTDLEEWRVRSRSAESPGVVAREDSLINALEGLYTLLLNQQGSFALTAQEARFQALAAGDQYDALSAMIVHLTDATPHTVEPASPTLALLLSLAGDGQLPRRVND